MSAVAAWPDSAGNVKKADLLRMRVVERMNRVGRRLRAFRSRRHWQDDRCLGGWPRRCRGVPWAGPLYGLGKPDRPASCCGSRRDILEICSQFERSQPGVGRPRSFAKASYHSPIAVSTRSRRSLWLPSNSTRKRIRHVRCFSPYLYRARNLIERFFNKIKQCRRVATRYDKLAANYLAFVKLASIRIWLRANESTA
jgi:transposase